MGRAPCCEKNGLKKGPWTPEEDKKLIDYIQKHGYGHWRVLPKNAGLQRCGKSCRLRWANYLRPDIKRGRFSFEEEETIIQLHSILGNKWSAIAARLPGRTDNEIKNYWNTHIRKRLLRMGIDPVTHNPRLDLLDLHSILGSSLYNPSSQMNLSRLLGVQQQPFINPEILRLASSLMSSQQGQNQNKYPIQNYQENQLHNSNQSQHLDQPDNHQFQNLPLTQIQEVPCTPTLNTSCVDQFQDMVQFQQSDFTNFGPQSVQCQNNVTDKDYVPLASCDYYMPPHQEQSAFMEHASSDTSAFQYNSNQSSQNLNLASVLSTPSSPAPLNSNSAYVNSSTEDELESYCSNMMKFEVPDFWDVSEFIL